MPAAAVPDPPWLTDTWPATAWEEFTWGESVVTDVPAMICATDVAIASPTVTDVTVVAC